MLSWIGILFGLALAVFVVKMGFYQSWALLFNIVISIYLGLFVGPIVGKIGLFTRFPSGPIVAIAAVAVVCFIVLQWVSYVLVTGQFNIAFPKVFDVLGASVLGFCAGFLVWSFAIVLVSVSPAAQNSFAQQMGLSENQSNLSYVCWWENIVNGLISSQEGGYSTEEAIEKLIRAADKKKKLKADVSDPNSASAEQVEGSDDPNDI